MTGWRRAGGRLAGGWRAAGGRLAGGGNRTMRNVTLIPPVRPLPAGTAELRSAVRGFLAAERAAGHFVPACDAWLSGWDESFSRRLAAHGWVGMTVPPEYGGHVRRWNATWWWRS